MLTFSVLHMKTLCKDVGSYLVYHLGVESELDLAPPVEKLLTSPEVTYISAQQRCTVVV